MQICDYDSGGSGGVFWAHLATWWSKMLHLRRAHMTVHSTAGLVPGRSARA